MNDAIEEMKIRAGLLLRKARAGERDALRRCRRAADDVQRKHCLDAVARELGFCDYRHARQVMDADGPVKDFGKLLYGPRNHGSLNHWFATHAEAQAHQRQHGGFLLGYARQVVAVGDAYLRDLGLDPHHEDWDRIGRDMVCPADASARRRIYATLLANLPRELAENPAPG